MTYIARLLIFIFFLISSGGTEVDKLPRSGFADIVEPLMPAVVSVYRVKNLKKLNRERSTFNKMFPEGSPFEHFNDFFDHFGLKEFEGSVDGGSSKSQALGSGFIIDSSGYIVTNNHVVKDADEISIKMHDSTEFEAKLVGSDSKTDLALLKVESNNPLPYVKFGDSDAIRVGDLVLAIGNPLGFLGGTVTSGIVSSKSRDIGLSSASIVDNLIQTDAAINQGNSGGPMFNMDKEVIGVNTAIYAAAGGGSIGIGFAIPSNTVKDVIDQLKSSGKVARGKLRVTIQEVTEEIAESLGMKEVSGALILNVEAGGAGDKAGLKSGDVVLEYNGTKINNLKKLYKLVAQTKTKEKVSIAILRKNKEMVLNADLVFEDSNDKSSDITDDISSVKGEIAIGGLKVSDLNDRMRERFSIEDDAKGVVITKIEKQSFANSRFMKGDVIISVNQQEVFNIQDFEKLYNKAKLNKKKNILFMVKRRGMDLFIATSVEGR